MALIISNGHKGLTFSYPLLGRIGFQRVIPWGTYRKRMRALMFASCIAVALATMPFWFNLTLRNLLYLYIFIVGYFIVHNILSRANVRIWIDQCAIVMLEPIEASVDYTANALAVTLINIATAREYDEFRIPLLIFAGLAAFAASLPLISRAALLLRKT